jgi:hypothetical protein
LEVSLYGNSLNIGGNINLGRMIKFDEILEDVNNKQL